MCRGRGVSEQRGFELSAGEPVTESVLGLTPDLQASSFPASSCLLPPGPLARPPQPPSPAILLRGWASGAARSSCPHSPRALRHVVSSLEQLNNQPRPAPHPAPHLCRHGWGPLTTLRDSPALGLSGDAPSRPGKAYCRLAESTPFPRAPVVLSLVTGRSDNPPWAFERPRAECAQDAEPFVKQGAALVRERPRTSSDFRVCPERRVRWGST